MQKLTLAQWQAISDALDQAVSLREDGIGGGHALLIHLLNQAGYRPQSSQEAERMASRILEDGYDE
jgi:hypothetical protein